MSITATQLKENLSLYLSKASEEDVVVTNHGHVIAVIVSPTKQKQKVIKSLVGILPKDLDTDKLLEERLSQI